MFYTSSTLIIILDQNETIPASNVLTVRGGEYGPMSTVDAATVHT